MKAFVTGATGLLGNNLVRLLHAGGDDVIGLVRSNEKAERLLGDVPAEWVVGYVRAAEESLSFRTNWSDTARISSSVAGGSKLKSVLMFLHIGTWYESKPVAGKPSLIPKRDEPPDRSLPGWKLGDRGERAAWPQLGIE